MSITGSSLSADGIRAMIQAKKDEEAAKARAHEAEAKAQREALYAQFLERDIRPDAMENIATVVRKAVEMGEKQAMVMRFPSEWLSDDGRAVTNHAPNWPETLTGFAKRGYDFFTTELEPRGFQIRADILDWPGGMPGDVGFFLTWKNPDEV
jgi:hypothetical protein